MVLLESWYHEVMVTVGTSLLYKWVDITFITLLMSGTAGYTFINIQAFKVNNWFIKVTFTRNPHLIPM